MEFLIYSSWTRSFQRNHVFDFYVTMSHGVSFIPLVAQVTVHRSEVYAKKVFEICICAKFEKKEEV